MVKINDLELVDEYGLTELPSLVYYRHSAPILFEAFSRLKPQPEPFAPPPGDVLIVSQPDFSALLDARPQIMRNLLATSIQRLAFDHLDAPVAIVGARNWITPCAEQEDLFFPAKEWILDTIHEEVLPLTGYSPSSDRSAAAFLRDSREGI